MKKFLSVTLSLLLAASMPLSALAESYDLAQGSITVEAKADGNQYVSQTGGVQQEQQTTETVIHQTDSSTTSTTNTITIQAEKKQTAQVTISDVNIDASSEDKAAISTGGDGSVTIELDGDNTARSGENHAGVEKNNGGNLTITDADGDGALEAVGSKYGAGIGGGDEQSASDITINGGDITAIGGRSGAGIGGGYDGNGSNITISGNAEVITAGGKYGAGIGGGDSGNGEITPNSDGLTTGFIAYYDSNANKGTTAPEKLLHNDGSGAHTHTGVTLKSSTAATCLNNATVTYLCSCGAEFTTELLGTAGHKLGEYTSNNDATCMADGTKTAHCTNPGCTYYVTVTDAGTRNPDKHSLSGYVSNNDATCMADGTKTARCTNPGCTYYVTVIDEGSRDPDKHSFTNYVSNNDATCSDAGHKTASCDNGCGATDVKIDENAPALGHTWGTYESNGNATCEQDGTKTAKCVRYGQGGCSATDIVTDVGSKLGHDFEAKDYVSNGDATCEQDGTKTAKCVRYGQGGCTATNTVTDTGSKLGHDFTDYIYNNNASYTEDGTETAHCNHIGCNETHTRKAEGTRWALFQVKDEKGWYVTYAESRSGNVLTITVNQNTATLSGTIAGLRVLQASGITTVIFKTTEAESTFHIADLLPGTSYNLTHKNTAVDFTLDGNDIATFLK